VGGGEGGGVGAGGGAGEEAETHPQPRREEVLMRAPEAAEVFEIAQTRNLYKSNLFRLQLEELLRELSPGGPRARLDAFLRGLQPVLLGLKPREITADFPTEFPLLHFHQRQPFPFSFRPPQRIDVVGSYLLGTASRPPRLCVDVALEMPSEAFQSKDYLNFRYCDKRAAYAGEVYRQLGGLRESEQCSDNGGGGAPLAGIKLSLEALQGDPFRPCVALVCGKDNGHRGARPSWSVRLLPACAPDLFAPVARLAPSRNAVRPLVQAPTTAVAPAPPPTAHYNSCLLEDSRMRSHLEYLHRCLQRVPATRDSILLLKRWAAARGFLPQQVTGGVSVFIPLSGFCLSMLAAHVGQTANVSPSQTSSFQLFKLVLSALGSTDWGKQKLILGKAIPTALSTEEQGLCGAHFYDEDGTLNFFWRLGTFIEEIRWEAQRTLRILDAETDPYDAVFGKVSSLELTWDVVVRTPALGRGALCPACGVAAGASPGAMSSSATPRPSGSGPGDDLAEEPQPWDTPEALALGARLAAILSAGLGARCLRAAIRLVGDPSMRWSKSTPLAEGGDGAVADGGVSVLVGFCLDAIGLEAALDRGPSAEDAEAAARFRRLWGPERAELRRFKDGSILECVVWTKPSPQRSFESRRHPAVVTQLVRHLLSRHFARIADGTDFVAGPIGFVPNLGDFGRRLWATFEIFRTHLCQLSSLPLSIKDIHPKGAAFSYMDVVPDMAPAAGDGIERTLHGVIVEFESSGRWPEDQQAAQKVCSAMLLKMREELQTDLGIEADVSEAFLDARYPEFMFRVEIFHAQEHMTTAHRVTNFQVQQGGAFPEHKALERLRTLWWQPRIRLALHGTVLQKPALAGAARLVKRWMASQMLSGYDEFVEHLTAAVFLQPAPFDAPTSPQVGFCRVCWLIATFDWQHEPLVVDFDGKLTEEERLSMRQSFERSRAESSSSAAAASFWVGSRFDPHALLLVAPPATVGAWLRRRAHHALDVCGQRLLGRGGPAGGDWQQLFSLDASIFDVMLHLGGPSAGQQARKVGGAKARRRRILASREAVASLVAKLRAHLSPVCLVFHDIERHTVALKWRPGAFLPQPNAALMGGVPHTMLAQGTAADQPPLCVPNVLCLTSIVASLAEGLGGDGLTVSLGGSDPH